MRVLIVEDEAKTLKFLAKGLREEGYAPIVCQDGDEGLALALSENFDLIILDVMLPGRNGTSICQELRRKGITTPVIMLSARDTVAQRIEGLDYGADDYLVKPFSFAELTARMRAMMRRKDAPAAVLALGELSVDALARKVRFRGEEINLTAKEFSILQCFLKRPGHILSRPIIAETAWGLDFDTGTNVVDVYVTFLRKKLRQATGKDWIKTHRGQGYSFEAPESVS